jgi:hypothetical protein
MAPSPYVRCAAPQLVAKRLVPRDAIAYVSREQTVT